MLKKLSILLAGGLAIALPSAFAQPTLSVSLQEMGFAAATATSSTGAVSINNLNYDDFFINTVSGIGTPVYNSPELALQTLDITSPNLTSAHTLTIQLTETGLTGLANPFTFGNAFTGNLKGVTSEKITSYIDPSNTAFGTAHQLATVTFTAQGADAYNQNVTASTVSPFSETEVIVAVFGTTTNNADSLYSSATISGQVPEPASMALLGGGLLGLAFLRRRSKKA